MNEQVLGGIGTQDRASVPWAALVLLVYLLVILSVKHFIAKRLHTQLLYVIRWISSYKTMSIRDSLNLQEPANCCILPLSVTEQSHCDCYLNFCVCSLTKCVCCLVLSRFTLVS